MITRYILRNKRVYAVEGEHALLAVSNFNEDDRIIRHTKLCDGVFVSTVFLHYAPSTQKGKPLVFETMVFDEKDKGDHYMQRYSTYNRALKGHYAVIKKIHKDTCWKLDKLKE